MLYKEIVRCRLCCIVTCIAMNRVSWHLLKQWAPFTRTADRQSYCVALATPPPPPSLQGSPYPSTELPGAFYPNSSLISNYNANFYYFIILSSSILFTYSWQCSLIYAVILLWPMSVCVILILARVIFIPAVLFYFYFSIYFLFTLHFLLSIYTFLYLYLFILSFIYIFI